MSHRIASHTSTAEPAARVIVSGETGSHNTPYTARHAAQPGGELRVNLSTVGAIRAVTSQHDWRRFWWSASSEIYK